MSEISMPILPKLPETSDSQLANSPNPSRMACQLLSGTAKPSGAAKRSPAYSKPHRAAALDAEHAGGDFIEPI